MQNYKSYLNEFKKRFKNYIKNAPIKINFFITPEHVIVKFLNIIKTYSFDYSIPPKLFISDINIEIEQYYPILLCSEEITLKVKNKDYKDVEKEIKLGKSLEEIFAKQKTEIKKTYYKIIKINILKNQIIIQNNENYQKLLYELTMPISVYLNKLSSEWTSEYGYKKFIGNSKFIKLV